MKADFALLLRSQPRRQTVPASLAVGDSTRRLATVDSGGKKLGADRLAANEDLTIIHFLSLKCEPCLDELPDWSRYLSTYGSQGVVFVAVGEESPVSSIPGIDIPARQILTLMRQASAPQVAVPLPYTVAVDRCGIVVEVVPGIGQLPSVLSASK